MDKLKTLIKACIVLFGMAAVLSPAWADECTDLYLAQNYKKALQVCEALAAGNDASAFFTVGQMSHNGYGVVQAQNEALVLFKKAAKSGHGGALNNIGYYYYNGVVVAQDFKRAFIWFSLAAAEGFTVAGPFRDMSAKHLDKEQIIQAQAMAKACRKSRYEMCD